MIAAGNPAKVIKPRPMDFGRGVVSNIEESTPREGARS